MAVAARATTARIGADVRAAFGDWLREGMGKIGCRSPQLARHLGVTVLVVEGWLAGRAAPNAEQCDRIGSLLGEPARSVRRRATLWALRSSEAATAPVVASPTPTVVRPPVRVSQEAIEVDANVGDEDGDGAISAPMTAATSAPEPEEEHATSEPAGFGQVVMTIAPTAAPPEETTDADAATGTTASSSPDESTPAAIAAQPTPSIDAVAEPEPPRRRRPARQPRPTAPEPVEPPVAAPRGISPTHSAGLRALADELERHEHDHQTLQAEVDQLRAEVDRLRDENAQLVGQLDRVRAAFLD